MFDRCCEKRSTTTYEIIHDPTPISLSVRMDEIIKDLLWYVPNIDSYQAKKNDLIANSVYDDFAFSYILQVMDMLEDRDVKWIEPNGLFDDDDWTYYEKAICCKCQKAIITRYKSHSKTNDLLRCIRNCIAHGHFTVVDDYIIGFNKNTSKSNPEGVKKAVVKIRPKLLLEALKSLTSPSGKEALLAYAFERIGYKVLSQAALSNQFKADLLIEKDGKKYIVEVKEYKGIRHLYPEHLEDFLSGTIQTSPDAERILFIDTSRVTKAVREREKEIEGFRIIDISQITEMLKEPPVDILAV